MAESLAETGNAASVTRIKVGIRMSLSPVDGCDQRENGAGPCASARWSCRSPAYSPGLGSYPTPVRRLLYSARGPAERTPTDARFLCTASDHAAQCAAYPRARDSTFSKQILDVAKTSWSKRQGVVELFPCLSSPNRTGAEVVPVV